MRTLGMSVEEIIVRLKDKMVQNKARFREAFKNYDIKRRGKVTKRDFRQVGYSCPPLYIFQEYTPSTVYMSPSVTKLYLNYSTKIKSYLSEVG